MIRRQRLAVLGIVAVVLLTSVANPTGDSPDPIVETLLERIGNGRAAAGAPRLEHRPALDRVALERARQIAALPEGRRLALGEPIDRVLERHGLTRYRRAFDYMDMKLGYRDPGAAFAATWQGYAQAWSSVLDPRRNAIGIATVEAADGWRILVAVLIEDRAAAPDPETIEQGVLAAINLVRGEHDLAELEAHPRLARVARAHSRDMLRRDYFAHVAPGGGGPADRVRAAGLRYRKVAENIQLNDDDADPVGTAVAAWMASPDHRRNLLDPDYTHTGIGVAVGDDGTIAFTQLFLLPPEHAP